MSMTKLILSITTAFLTVKFFNEMLVREGWMLSIPDMELATGISQANIGAFVGLYHAGIFVMVIGVFYGETALVLWSCFALAVSQYCMWGGGFMLETKTTFITGLTFIIYVLRGWLVHARDIAFQRAFRGPERHLPIDQHRFRVNPVARMPVQPRLVHQVGFFGKLLRMVCRMFLTLKNMFWPNAQNNPRADDFNDFRDEQIHWQFQQRL